MPSWYSIWSQTEFWRFHKKCLLLGESWQLIVKILMLWWRSSVQFQQLNCWECLFIFSSCQNSTVNRIVAISPNFVMKSQNMPVFVKKKCALQILQQFKYVCPWRSWNIHACIEMNLIFLNRMKKRNKMSSKVKMQNSNKFQIIWAAKTF